MNNFFNFTVSIEWITFLASIVILDKKTTFWRLFILLMLLIVATEAIGWYMYSHMHIPSNALPFNMLMIISDVFLVWFFSTAPSLKKIKRTLAVLMGFFLLFAAINMFFFQGFIKYNSYTESLADIVLSIISCYFLFSLIRDDNQVDLVRFDYFWFAIGVLFYSLGSALLYQFSDILGRYYKLTKINVGNYINYSLNFILYGCLIIAFICRRKTTR